MAAIAAAVLLATTCAHGLVLHPDAEPDETLDRPPNTVIGKWASSASAVAIGPNYVITTRHQSGIVGTPVTIAGESYAVEEILLYESGGNDLDIRVARISGPGGRPANLSDFVDMYADRDERWETVVLGGYGRHRDQDVLDGDTVIGYTWSDGAELLWGTNRIDGTGIANTTSGFTTETLKADFDALGRFATDYEAALAERDSGSGWFLQDQGVWELAGLGGYLPNLNEHPEQSHFSPPDPMWGVRLSGYVSMIQSDIDRIVVPEGDANWDGAVDFADLDVLTNYFGTVDLVEDSWWRQADFNNDQATDFADFVILSNNFGAGTELTTSESEQILLDAGVMLPEPTALVLFGAGAGLLFRRRRATRPAA